MDSVIIEPVGCPLDSDLLKSWERFSLEDSHSCTSSDHSESADEGTEISHDEGFVLKQLKNLTLLEISEFESLFPESSTKFDLETDVKSVLPKCVNKNCENNSQNKDTSEEIIFLEKEEIERNQLSTSSFENEDLIKFDVETDVKTVLSKCLNKKCENNSQNKINHEENIFLEKEEIEESQSPTSSFENGDLIKFDLENDVKSVLSKCLNKNYEGNFQRKNNTKKHNGVDNAENKENQLHSSSLKSNKLLNNSDKTSSEYVKGYEIDSDFDEDDEKVTLRERFGAIRHSRPENNKQKRPSPFPQSHTRTYTQHLHSNNSQTHENISPMLYNHDAFHYAYDSQNDINRANFVRHGAVSPFVRPFPSCFPSSDSVIDATFGDTVSGTVIDQTVNGFFPCTSTNQSDNYFIPRTGTHQTVNNVMPYPGSNGVLDSVVPFAYDIENFRGELFLEINDIPCINNLDETIFSESNDLVCSPTEEEIGSFFNCLSEDIPTEVNHSSENLMESTSVGLSGQNYVLPGKETENVWNNSSLLNQIQCVSSIIKGISDPKSNGHAFTTESGNFHSFYSKANVEKTSFYSNSDNSILENSAEFNRHEYSVRNPGNFTNLISQSVTSINRECLSPTTSSYINTPELNKTWKEIKNWLSTEQNGASEHSPSVTDVSWGAFPFANETSVSDSNNTSNSETLPKKNKEKKEKRKYSKRNRKNKTQKQTCNAEKPKICLKVQTYARDRLLHSAAFSISNWETEDEKIRQQITDGKIGTEKKKVIHYLNKNRATKYRGTNLHKAITDGNTEQVFCIVEYHKEYHNTTFEINARDSDNKTVLDYAKEKGLELLADYLEENHAKESVNV